MIIHDQVLTQTKFNLKKNEQQASPEEMQWIVIAKSSTETAPLNFALKTEHTKSRNTLTSNLSFSLHQIWKS